MSWKCLAWRCDDDGDDDDDGYDDNDDDNDGVFIFATVTANCHMIS